MKNYYRMAKKGSLQIGGHKGLEYLRNLCSQAGRVLDVGCGEGSRLQTLLPASKGGWGIDMNSQAIKMAQTQYPHHKFQVADAAKLPFKDSSFDLVYSAFAIEHCLNPEKFILEMFRVCKTNSTVVILTPNFGAPNRRSPVSDQNPFSKFFHGLISDYLPSPTLNWKSVQPHSVYNRPDDDTTVEPYLHSLVWFIARLKHKVIVQSSLWELELFNSSPRKLLFKLLGSMDIFPFRYWGPQAFVAAIK